ncbi:MAG: hypothetical protein ACF8Q5_12225 [Phycisphaerales bacterium JB040]
MTTLTPTNPPPARDLPADSPVHALRIALRRACAQARRVLLVRAGSKVVASCVVTLVGLILIDYALRFPGALRWVLLGCAIALVAHLVRRWWLVAWSIRPTPTDLALRLEPLAGAGWTGRLASGLELAEPDPRDTEPQAIALRAAAVHRAVRGFDPALTARAVNPTPALRWGAVALASLAFALLLASWKPGLAQTGLRRTLMPWTDAEWPRRQIVEHVEGDGVLPIDRAVPLRALVTTTNRAPGETPVWAQHRLIIDGQARPWERVRLTPQNATPGQALAGELYERLVEPVVPGAEPDRQPEVTLEYRLETEDDTARRRSVQLVYPPRVVSGDLTVQLPEYATGLEASGRFLSGAVELGDGNDARNSVGPVLAGSSLTLRLRFNKPVSITAVQALLEQFDDAGTLDIETADDSAGATVRGVLNAPALLPLTLTDEHGIRTRGEPAYRVDVVEDLPPSIAVVTPERDEDVLPTAAVALLARAEDDLALRAVSLVADVVRIDASADTEPDDRGIELASVIAEGSTTTEAGATLALTPLTLVPGDEVRVTAIASDAYTGPGGAPRDQVRSRARTLRIISETTLINQLRAELAGLRRAAMRLDEQQAQVEARTRDAGEADAPDVEPTGEPATPDELAREQDDIANRIAQQGQAARRLAERLERNALEDDTLRALLEQGEEILENAQEAADEAGERLARDDREGAEEEQREVRDEISRLVALLDRGEDSWLARQGLQRLLDEQRDIQEATARMQERTLGRETEQLTEDERSELQKIADRQRAAARRAEEAIDELENAAERMRERDPAQAAALEEAAATARRARLPDRLDAAAGQIGENQTQQAQQQQQQAIDDMQQALDQLDEGERLRDEALRRVLASLVETLEVLVDDQAFELANLDNAEDAGRDVVELAPAMLNLQQRTLDATAQAAGGGADLAVVTERLDRAQDAQGKAINALRAQGAQADRVRPFERTALEHLEAALEEAREAEEDAAGRAARREQEELRQAYTDLAARQRELIGQPPPYTERQLSRRERAAARGLATSQDQIASDLDALEQEHQAIDESPVFRLAHERAARLSERVARSLRDGTPGARDTLTQQSIADLLEQLAASLEDLPPPEEGFERDSASNQGGGGGSGGEDPPAIPPIAELVVLRTLQDQAARATELADTTGEPADLDDAVSIQRAVAEQARALLESMQSDQNPQPEGLQPAPDAEIPNNGPDSGDSTGGEPDGSDAP